MFVNNGQMLKWPAEEMTGVVGPAVPVETVGVPNSCTPTEVEVDKAAMACLMRVSRCVILSLATSVRS